MTAALDGVANGAIPMRLELDLPPAVPGERLEMQSPAGKLSYYTDGPGGAAQARPLLLIHSINAAASAFEVKPLYDHYRRLRPVYALELPGFGFSERSEREYTPRLMTDAIHAMARQIQETRGDTAIDALALSLSSEFLARAASESPAPWRSLALISPTGFDRRAPYDGPPGSNRGLPWLYKTFTFSPWERGFYNLLTSRASIRFFLKKTFGAKTVSEDFVEYDYRTARQPGARRAPYYFVSGYLFSNDSTRLYRDLTMPVWMAHGVRGDFVDYRYKQAFEDKPNWIFQVFSSGALPHFEIPEKFIRRYDSFLDGLDRQPATAVPE